MTELYRCWRCGYHYGPRGLVIEPGRRFPVCADRERCNARIEQRERDHAAVRVVRRP